MSAPPRFSQYSQLLLAVILLKPFSNLFLAWGSRALPGSLSAHPLLLATAILNPLILLGVAMQALWLLLRMRLLSIADLSYVLPVTAIGYVITTLLGWLFLHEHVSASRWAGTVLISFGTALVAGSRHPMSPLPITPRPDSE
jgi:uncharacterized membrane protein